MIREEFTQYLSDAVDKICSPEYQQAFEKVAKEQPASLSQEDNVLLAVYPNELCWYKGNRRPELVERCRQTHASWFNNWLAKYTDGRPPYTNWNSTMSTIYLHLLNTLYRMDLGDEITSESTREIFQQTIYTVKDKLKTINEANPESIDSNALPLVRELLQIFFYFTIDQRLVFDLKAISIVDTVNTLIRTSNADKEVCLNAYRILAAIMDEEDIKKLENANQIASVFINFIDQASRGGLASVGRFHNSLRSLKILAQHDQIRDELIQQGGQAVLIRCALENNSDSVKAKLPALEILLALTFNKDFPKILKTNQEFMNHLTTLTSSEHEGLQKVATGLIWKLEKEPELSTQVIEEKSSVPVISKKKYDIMISYSHSDKELCHRIAKNLENDKFNIWIDSKLMHGATFDAMANAIENTEFVFLCMSDAYKQSPFCEMEASYAVKRRCRIIPLVMTPGYKADGWLGVLTSAFIYVDFPKLSFAKAYDELRRQIQLYQAKPSVSTSDNGGVIAHNPPKLKMSTQNTHSSSRSNNTEPHPKVDYPHCIDLWTANHVKSFLLEKNLDCFLVAFEGMNGHLLHRVYDMCESNPQAMFSSLKEDVAGSQTNTLTLKDYLNFLEEIKIYIPMKSINPMNPASSVCNVM